MNTVWSQPRIALNDQRVGSAIHDPDRLRGIKSGARQPIVEAGFELHRQLYLAGFAAHDANELSAGARFHVAATQCDRHQVGEGQDTRSGSETSLQDVGSGQVPASHLIASGWRDPEVTALAPVEQPAEAWSRIEAPEAAPIDGPVPRNQRRGLAVPDQGIGVDRRVFTVLRAAQHENRRSRELFGPATRTSRSS